MRICTVIGARPQFIKAAAVSSVMACRPNIEEIIIHTGQHYDKEMSDIFFEELKLPREKYNLAVGSGSHAVQTANILCGVEDVLIKEHPDWILVYGDTNSTLAGALAAVKLHIKCAHVEAGMRSFNRAMPEEINRIVTDRISDINFCSTTAAFEHLKSENLGDTAVLTGDVMYDCALKFIRIAEKYYSLDTILPSRTNFSSEYVLLTCHRAENTNSFERLKAIVEAVNIISEFVPVVYPMHPRIKKYLKEYGVSFSDNVFIIHPVSYFKMLVLEKNAKLILTDSGGIQKEALFVRTPCVTMRDETEWIETVEAGWNVLTGADKKKIVDTVMKLMNSELKPKNFHFYGDGHAAEKIVNFLCGGLC